MPEAEELIVDAARHATVAIREVWRRHLPPPPGPPVVLLRDLKPRLAMLLDVVLGREVPIRVAQAEVPRSLARRFFARNRVLTSPTPLPGTDGTAIYLPPSLPRADDRRDVDVDDYALLALLHAFRCVRGSAHVFDGALGMTADLYRLGEAVAADAALRQRLPGWQRALDALYERVAGVSVRVPSGPLDAEIAARHSALLLRTGHGIPLHPTPNATLEWARSCAADMQQRHPHARYVSSLGDLVIGRLFAPEGTPERSGKSSRELTTEPDSRRSASLARRPRVRRAAPDEDDGPQGPWMVQTSEPQPHAEDPLGLNRPEDREPDGDLKGAAESLAELDEARLVHTPGRARETFFASDPPPRLERAQVSDAAATGLYYPEWDYQAGRYVERAVTVHVEPAAAGPVNWVDAALARHTGLMLDIRRRLGAIRPGRDRLRARTSGDDVDLDAWVAGRGEARAGAPGDDAFYQSERPAPRRLAVMLLIDASASTDAWVTASARVIDLEKEAALLAAAALETLRTAFAALAFSGEGAGDVELREIKRFDEAWGRVGQCRVAGLEPDRYTRLGAAVRHASRCLAAQPAHHRLLLLLSDGRPNDCDRYASRYGLEDARQALVETRLQHIVPYCFTVDREGGEYLPQLFGDVGYTVVQHPQQLPRAFVDWLRKAAQCCAH